jgi:hypothetical protein
MPECERNILQWLVLRTACHGSFIWLDQMRTPQDRNSFVSVNVVDIPFRLAQFSSQIRLKLNSYNQKREVFYEVTLCFYADDVK